MLTGVALLNALKGILKDGRMVLQDPSNAMQVMGLVENLGMEVGLAQRERWWILLDVAERKGKGG